MAKTYRSYLPEQDLLLPPSLGDWLPEDHLAYFVSDVVASVVTPKPANGGQGKTGQRKGPGTKMFYPAASCRGKSIFVRQLRGPHLST